MNSTIVFAVFAGAVVEFIHFVDDKTWKRPI
jgi:hypothetical protein